MLGHERREKILELIGERKTCTIEELRRELGVSQVTLYRDLKHLHGENLIHRVHGGVVAPEPEGFESRWSIRLQTQSAPKETIGRHAAQFVENGWAIFVDASSTCYMFARQLAARNLRSLTLVTNSPQIPLEFEPYPQVRLISTGGELLHELNAFAGPLALETLSKLHFDAAFVSCAGVSPASGATTESPLLAQMLRAVSVTAGRLYLLADSSKFLRRAMLTSLPLDQLDQIVTDSSIADDVLQQFRQARADVTVV